MKEWKREIKKNTAFYGTRPEMFVRAIMTELNRNFKTNDPSEKSELHVKEFKGNHSIMKDMPDGSRVIVDEPVYKEWDFKPDLTDFTPERTAVIEVDGYFFFQYKKYRDRAKWKDKVYLENGIKVIHVSYFLTQTKVNYDPLKQKLLNALNSSDMLTIIHSLDVI